MQSAAPHWALSAGVIKAFKRRHPLSLHMSAPQSDDCVWKETGALHVPSVVSNAFSLLLRYFLTNVSKALQ